ncbi:hypothetical protein SCB49_05025 [unidentified eubacterium SCB49]|nr:hypothetical protein SCB49_05025 [unidentified eubacterium SCB49]
MIADRRLTILDFKLTTISKRFLIGFLCLFTTAVSFAQVQATIDTTSIKIGEELTYTMTIEADTTDLVVFPEGQQFLPMEVIESYKLDTILDDYRYRFIKKYGLTQFDSGSYKIPAQRVIVNNKQFTTDTMTVEVRDVVVDTTQQKMFQIKDKIEVDSPPFDFIKLLLWLLAILVLIGIVAFIFFRRKKLREAKEEDLPPYEEAISALHKLDDSQLLIQNKSKEYYSVLTEIVKKYLDREVDDTALESTTDELIDRLKAHKNLGNFDFDPNMIKDLELVLKRADLVKFAKMQQASGQLEADRKTLELIINDTHEAIPEPTEEELLENERYKEAQRKKKVRKIWMITTGSVIIAVILAIAIGIAIYGYSATRDFVFGNDMRELQEDRWVRSEYGIPTVIVETPEVLVRVEMDQVEQAVKSSDAFAYGSLEDDLYIMINTIQYNGEEKIEPDTAIEAGLNKIEQGGASNFIVKKEDFETPNGIGGVRASGSFNIKKGNGFREQEYQYVVFGQPGALQQIVIVNNKQNLYAKQIVERIINSLEIELTQGEK